MKEILTTKQVCISFLLCRNLEQCAPLFYAAFKTQKSHSNMFIFQPYKTLTNIKNDVLYVIESNPHCFGYSLQGYRSILNSNTAFISFARISSA